MKAIGRSYFSLLLIFILACIILYSRLQLPNWYATNVLSILSWDVFGYYLYLPAKFIYNDLGIRNFTWVQEIISTYHPTTSFYQAYPGPIGDYIMKYPLGMAILYTPFFFMGHFYAHLFHFPPDGFSVPYQFSISMGCLFYTFIGLWFFRKILLRYFDELTTSVTLLIIVLGTNYFEISAFEGAMPHNILFMLFALIVWLTIRWHESPSVKLALPLGIFMGLCIIVRPTSGIIILVPLLWNLSNKASFMLKLSLIRKNWIQVLVIAAGLAMTVAIQLFYWKIQSGQWFYYSYEKSEKLQWIAPYLWNVLFSYKKGWLLYAPAMVFILPGFILLFRKNRAVFLSILLFFIIHVLLVSSWPTWWYGGSFGQRTMMESYLLLAFPLAALVKSLQRSNGFTKLLFSFILVFFIVLNLFQTWQYIKVILPPTGITKQYYWSVFGSMSVKEKDQFLLESDSSLAPEQLINIDKYAQKSIINHTFEPINGNLPWPCSKAFAHHGESSFRLDSLCRFSSGLTDKFRNITQKEFAWLRATGNVYFTGDSRELNCCLVMTFLRKGKPHKYKMLTLESLSLKSSQWNTVTMDYLSPPDIFPNDTLQVYFWYRGNNEVYIDDLEISLFEPKEE